MFTPPGGWQVNLSSSNDAFKFRILNSLARYAIDHAAHRLVERTSSSRAIVITVWYVLAAYTSFGRLSSGKLLRLIDQGTANVAWNALWPVAWLGSSLAANMATPLVLLSLVACAIATQTWHSSRLVRVISAALFFVSEALVNSLGKIDHGSHVVIFGLLFFCFGGVLKSGAGRGSQELRWNTVLWRLQLLVGLLYSMGGGAKLATGIFDWLGGVPGYFSATAAQYYAAAAILGQGAVPPLARFFLDHGGYWSTILLVGGALLELIGLPLAAFGSFYHRRLWSVGIAALHIGIVLIIGPDFGIHAIAVLLLFYCYGPNRSHPATVATPAPAPSR